jgi:hypothetical protein
MTMASSLVPPGADLCALPLAISPDGQPPNFANPTSLTTTTIVIGVLMMVWALAFVAARVVVNIRKLSWSDCGLNRSRPNMILENGAKRSRLHGNRHDFQHGVHGSLYI